MLVGDVVERGEAETRARLLIAWEDLGNARLAGTSNQIRHRPPLWCPKRPRITAQGDWIGSIGDDHELRGGQLWNLMARHRRRVGRMTTVGERPRHRGGTGRNDDRASDEEATATATARRPGLASKALQHGYRVDLSSGR